MVALRVLAVFLVVLCGAPGLASALRIRCSDWTRMGPGAQQQTLYRMIAESPNDPMLRGRQINAMRLQMCLERSIQWMEADFHEACSRGQQANLQILNDIFTQYVSGCTSGGTGYR